MPSLFLEALCVGLVLAACLAAFVRFSGPLVSVRDAVVSGFVMGVCIHLGFEAVGANSWYCRKGWACST